MTDNHHSKIIENEFLSSSTIGSIDDELQINNNLNNNNNNNNIVGDKDDTDKQLYRKMTVPIVGDKSALHCKNGCGFYGNREWGGLCSICYKEIRQQQQQHQQNMPLTDIMVSSTQTPTSTLQQQSASTQPTTQFQQSVPISFVKHKLLPDTLNRAHSATSLSHSASSFLSNPTGSLSFRKFEQKKRQQSDTRRSIKSIFKRASTFREYRSTSSTSSSPSSSSQNNNENNSWQIFSSLEKPLMLGEEVLAKLFSDYALHDINVNVNKCVEKANKLLNRGCSIDEITELIHDFYSMMDNRFQTNPQYKDVDNIQYNELIDQTEKILMNKLYTNLFARVQNEEEERDLELQKKIRNLNWIMSQHLDVDINLRHPKVKDLMDQAITEIIELDSRHVPYEKLESIVRCSKTIFSMLQINNNDAISADHFLPAVVFVIIQANPPLLQSNIKFITRFSTPSRLMTGEAGYYFTNLCCATTFIEEISGKSLNMSETDFQSYMKGEAQPPGYYKQSFLCEPFRILNSNHLILNDTIKRYEQWKENLDGLEQRLDRFEEILENKCRQALNTSQELIEQHSNYKIFNVYNVIGNEQNENQKTIEMLLPTHFKDMYLECKNKQFYDNENNNENPNILIDVQHSEPVKNVNDNYDSQLICDDELNSIKEFFKPDINLIDNNHNLNKENDEITNKFVLPSTLSPEIINPDHSDSLTESSATSRQ